MMIETSPNSSTPRDMGEAAIAEKDGDQQQEQQQEPQNAENADDEVPAPAPKPRKTWALPKAPPKDLEGPPKKTLLDIMAEEEKTSEAKRMEEQNEREKRLAQEEEAALMQAMQASMAAEPAAIDDDDDMDEDMKLALKLSMQDQTNSPVGESSASPYAAGATEKSAAVAAAAPAAAATPTSNEENALTEEEMKEIEKALKEADAAESAKSIQLALELQKRDDAAGVGEKKPRRIPQGNVRTMNREEFLREQGKGDTIIDYDDDYDYDDLDDNGMTEAGFRINSSKPSAWLSSTDRAKIIGPNQEQRTKHDLKLQAQANAYRLEIRADDETGERAHVGNKAYNAFHRSMQRKTVKGVAAHGHGRATADTDKTREGALDGRVRLQIARAVNARLIEDFHGCVKEGKEALVFHADKGEESEGFDVAVKVFKRITEFKNRGEYVTGDPRYGDAKNFRNAKPRQQVEQWAEKEHRNLIRAYRAKVPCPRPLWTKENVLFLRFLGEEGWPAPQLRELDMKKGSKKWTALYEQTMSAMQRLYCDARLIHGDLSEYNILVCPAKFLKRISDDMPFFDSYGFEKNGEKKQELQNDNRKPAAATAASDDDGDQKPASTNNGNQKLAAAHDGNLKVAAVEDGDKKQPAKQVSFSEEEQKFAADSGSKVDSPADNMDDEELQVALIDFGQAVDQRHPEAEALLQRDVLRVKQFFDKMGITTISVEAAMAYVQTRGAPLR